MRRRMRPPFSWWLTFAAVLGGAASAGEARAQPTSSATEYSDYEREAIDAALKDLGRKIDPAPEGKTIGTITSVRLEVLEPRDPGPELLRRVPLLSPGGRYLKKSMLNSLHVLSKEYVIRRELLLAPGEPYRQVLVDETARNMRSRMPMQVSLIVIVPVESSAPGEVDLLVITKDIWSLRLSFDIAATAYGVEDLVIVPQETNFLGRHHTLQTRFQLQPETLTFGVGYKVPRFGRSWVGADASAAVFMNRRSFSPEGSSVGVSVGRPLSSTRAEWAWSADAGYAVGVARRYSKAKVVLFNSSLTPERDGIPWEYDSRSVSASAAVTRSFGWGVKHNFSLGLNAKSSSYSLPDRSRFDPVAVADFRDHWLPRGEARVYPALTYRTYKNDYLRTLDINTLALQEDYRLGHDASVSLYPVMRALGSSRDLVGGSAKLAYAVAMGDGLAGASASASAEVHDGEVSDGAIGVSFGAVTPRIFGLGRIAMNASLSNRYANYLNGRTSVGGGDRLRGYPTGFFLGKDAVYYNIEYRSRSVEILKAQLGAVAFFDAADAAQGLDKLHAKQSLGFGLRALFPQVNRLVFRLDVAFPMDRGPFVIAGTPTYVDPVGIFFAFDQAFAP